MIFVAAVFLLSTAVHSPAMTQDGYEDNSQDQAVPVQPSLPETRQGETVRSAAGQVGQRQTRDAVAAEAGIEQMARISGRIQNRVQSRIRNRIDKYYDPQANTTSPFAVASDQARAAGRPRR